MKKSLAFLMAILMTISLCACDINQLLSQNADGEIDTGITQTPKEVPEVKISADDFVGSW